MAGPWLGEARACDLAFSLLLAEDTIPAKKPPPSPSSFGHQYRKFSFEGTTGPLVTLLGHFGFKRGGTWVTPTCLPKVPSPCQAEEEQTATGSAPQEFREGPTVLCWLGDWGNLFVRTLKPDIKLRVL